VIVSSSRLVLRCGIQSQPATEAEEGREEEDIQAIARVMSFGLNILLTSGCLRDECGSEIESGDEGPELMVCEPFRLAPKIAVEHIYAWRRSLGREAKAKEV